MDNLKPLEARSLKERDAVIEAITELGTGVLMGGAIHTVKSGTDFYEVFVQKISEEKVLVFDAVAGDYRRPEDGCTVRVFRNGKWVQILCELARIRKEQRERKAEADRVAFQAEKNRIAAEKFGLVDDEFLDELLVADAKVRSDSFMMMQGGRR